MTIEFKKSSFVVHLCFNKKKKKKSFKNIYHRCVQTFLFSELNECILIICNEKKITLKNKISFLYFKIQSYFYDYHWKDYLPI